MTASLSIEDLIRQVVREEIKAVLADIDAAKSATASLIDIPEAARRLGMSVSYIRKRITDGRLPTEKVGNRHRIAPHDLERLRSPKKAAINEAAVAMTTALQKLGVRRTKR